MSICNFFILYIRPKVNKGGAAQMMKSCGAENNKSDWNIIVLDLNMMSCIMKALKSISIFKVSYLCFEN